MRTPENNQVLKFIVIVVDLLLIVVHSRYIHFNHNPPENVVGFYDCFI